ncbi:MAG: hypothetical protein FTV4_gp1 [Fushun totivirus 4]|nr:MAG: hypothetical protein FTV4_gp1 [Fushun totivirus 4]
MSTSNDPAGSGPSGATNVEGAGASEAPPTLVIPCEPGLTASVSEALELPAPSHGAAGSVFDPGPSIQRLGQNVDGPASSSDNSFVYQQPAGVRGCSAPVATCGGQLPPQGSAAQTVPPPLDYAPDYTPPVPMPIPQNVQQLPPGHLTPFMPPIQPRGEPEARGLVSSRWHTAEPPSQFTHHNDLATVFKEIPEIKSNEGAPPGTGLFTVNMEKWLLSPDEVAYARKTRCVRFKRAVVGSIKGVAKTVRDFTLDFSRAEQRLAVVNDQVHTNKQPLEVQPGYAAAFSRMTDETAIKARRSMAAIFPDATATPPDIAAVTTHGRSLLDAGVDCSRFMMRLAVLNVEASHANIQDGGRVTFDTIKPAKVVPITTWVEFRRAVQDDMRGGETNYIPWHTTDGYNPIDNVALANVIRLAASRRVTVTTTRNEHKELLCWPPIPHARLATTTAISLATERDDVLNLVLSPTDVNIAARMWVSRYGNMEIFNQYMQFYAMYYWAKQGENYPIVSPFGSPTIMLPPAAMRGFLMFPFLQTKADQASLMNHIQPLDTNRMVAESLSAVILIGYVATRTRWRDVDYAMLQGCLSYEGMAASTNVFKSIGGTVSFWHVVQATIRGLGYTGEIGHMLGNLHSTQTPETYLKFATSEACRLSSGDVLPFLPVLEQGCSAQGWVQPEPLPDPFSRSEQATRFADFPVGSASKWIPTLLETEGVRYYRMTERRRTFSSVEVSMPITDLATTRSGCIVDFPMLAITGQYGDRYRWGYMVNTQATFALFEKTHDRYNMTWKVINLVDEPMTEQTLVLSPMYGTRPDPPLRRAIVKKPTGKYWSGQYPPDQLPPMGPLAPVTSGADLRPTAPTGFGGSPYDQESSDGSGNSQESEVETRERSASPVSRNGKGKRGAFKTATPPRVGSSSDDDGGAQPPRPPPAVAEKSFPAAKRRGHALPTQRSRGLLRTKTSSFSVRPSSSQVVHLGSVEMDRTTYIQDRSPILAQLEDMHRKFEELMTDDLAAYEQRKKAERRKARSTKSKEREERRKHAAAPLSSRAWPGLPTPGASSQQGLPSPAVPEPPPLIDLADVWTWIDAFPKATFIGRKPLLVDQVNPMDLAPHRAALEAEFESDTYVNIINEGFPDELYNGMSPIRETFREVYETRYGGFDHTTDSYANAPGAYLPTLDIYRFAQQKGIVPPGSQNSLSLEEVISTAMTVVYEHLIQIAPTAREFRAVLPTAEKANEPTVYAIANAGPDIPFLSESMAREIAAVTNKARYVRLHIAGLNVVYPKDRLTVYSGHYQGKAPVFAVHNMTVVEAEAWIKYGDLVAYGGGAISKSVGPEWFASMMDAQMIDVKRAKRVKKPEAKEGGQGGGSPKPPPPPSPPAPPASGAGAALAAGGVTQPRTEATAPVSGEEAGGVSGSSGKQQAVHGSRPLGTVETEEPGESKGSSMAAGTSDTTAFCTSTQCTMPQSGIITARDVGQVAVSDPWQTDPTPSVDTILNAPVDEASVQEHIVNHAQVKYDWEEVKRYSDDKKQAGRELALMVTKLAAAAVVYATEGTEEGDAVGEDCGVRAAVGGIELTCMRVETGAGGPEQTRHSMPRRRNLRTMHKIITTLADDDSRNGTSNSPAGPGKLPANTESDKAGTGIDVAEGQQAWEGHAKPYSAPGEEFKALQLVLKTYGIEWSDWQAVRTICIDELLAAHPRPWPERLQLYNCLDACQQRINNPELRWTPSMQETSPLDPTAVAAAEVGDTSEEKAKQLRDAAEIVLQKLKWPLPLLNERQERAVLHATLMYLSPKLTASMATCLRHVWKAQGLDETDENAFLLCLLEAATVEKEIEAVKMQQVQAVDAAALFASQSGKLWQLLGDIKQNGTVAARSTCLHEGVFNEVKQNPSYKERAWRKWHTTLSYGGCPAVVEQQFGGRWPRRENYKHECESYHHGYNAFKIWVTTLTRAQLARFLLLVHPATIGPEHYRDLGSEVDIQITPKGQPMSSTERDLVCSRKEILLKLIEAGDTTGDGWSHIVGQYVREAFSESEWRWKSDMPRRPTKGGMPITFTAQMALSAYPGAGPLLELLHNRSPESDESEVAATLIGLLSLPHYIGTELLCSLMLEVPLNTWWKEFSLPLSRVRRSLCLDEIRFDEGLLAIRKLLNVTIRTDEEANMDVEDWNRGMVITRKHTFAAPGVVWPQSAYSDYEQRYAAAAKKVVGDAFGAQKAGVTEVTAEKHWSERGIRGAAGSSKMIKSYPLAADVPEIHDSDRPGKKVLVEWLDDNALTRTLAWHPQQRAYFFVKPEPGHKQRALYATYDEESFVSSYANAAIENTMGRTPGVFVRQTPADVIEWCAVSSGGIGGPEGAGAYWVSTDYSDYNSEHTLFEMAMLDRTCAQWFEGRLAANDEITRALREKALAHNWCAVGRGASVILFSGANEKFDSADRSYLPILQVTETNVKRILLVTNGLFSGSRTTARDNTWIHAIDLTIAREVMRSVGNSDCFRWHAVCGDDEDAAFDSVSCAPGYITSLLGTNHNLNPIKQMGGETHHEFLQFVNCQNERIEKSRFTLLATLATGNWYVQKGIWIQSVLAAVVANYWELYCRGVPLQICRRLAAQTLDLVMVVRGTPHDQETPGIERAPIEKRLEWWKFRFSRNLPPLFEWRQGDAVIEQPRFEALIEPGEKWPRAASKAVVRNNKHLLRALPPRIAKEMESTLLSSTVGAAAKVLQQQAAKHWAFKHWDERETDAIGELATAEDWRRIGRDPVDFSDFRYGMPRKKAMLTEEDVAGRMGVPFFVARRLGGTAKLGQYVTPEQWSKYADTSQQFIPLSANGYELQTNLRAALTWSTQQVAPFHGMRRSLLPKRMLYVYMGNGAGKTHIARLWRRAQDIDAVWMDANGSLRQRADAAWEKSCFEPFTDNMQEILQIARRRSSILLGQVKPSLILRAAGNIGLDIKIAYYDPGESVRRSRLLSRPGWDSGRVERRILRSNQGYYECLSLGGTRLADSATVLETIKRFDAETCALLEELDPGIERMPAKFVFNKSGPLSRALEIDMETQ